MHLWTDVLHLSLFFWKHNTSEVVFLISVISLKFNVIFYATETLTSNKSTELWLFCKSTFACWRITLLTWIKSVTTWACNFNLMRTSPSSDTGSIRAVGSAFFTDVIWLIWTTAECFRSTELSGFLSYLEILSCETEEALILCPKGSDMWVMIIIITHVCREV